VSYVRPTAVGTRSVADERVALSSIIERINELFGTQFTENDRLFIEHMVEAGKADQTVRERAQANTYENFALSIKDLVQNLVIDGLERHDQLATRYLNEDEFKREIFEHVARRIYDELRRSA
jgi:type I restriction enzyme R subunit